jgi:16S rRNA (cytosine1402-N4)-methyltransferase
MKRHIPIMVHEILSYIPEHAKLIVDGTFGHGGHTLAIIKKLKDESKK